MIRMGNRNVIVDLARFIPYLQSYLLVFENRLSW